MKKFLSLIMVLALSLSLAACGGGSSDKPADKPAESGAPAENKGDAPADGEVYTCSLQFTFPESSAAKVEEKLHELEEASNGRLKFEVYYSYSMVSNADVVDALQDGTLDVAGLMPVEYSFFNLNGRLTAMPLMGYPTNESATQIYLSELYNNADMMAEFTDNNLIFWAGSMVPGYQMWFAEDVTATDPSIFSGLTIMCDNAEMQTFIADNGGAVAASYPPDYYSNLSNGVAEGLVQHLNCVNAFGCIELIKTAVNFGEGGFYNMPLVYCISENFWNSLPEDLQTLMGDYADDICRAAYDNDMQQLENNQVTLEQSSATIVTLDEGQIAQWQSAFAGSLEDALGTISSANPAADQVYQEYTDMIANYDAASFSIGTNNFGNEVAW